MYEAIVFLPLLGAFIAGIFGPIIGPRASIYVTSGFMVLVAILSAIAFANVAIYEGPKTITILEWIHSGNFEADWKLRIDTLTATMLVVVNGVSCLVHIYSIGYMSHDPHQSRFFAYLSLFTFAMLMLVTADNFLQLFFGWEGVGLASYLLIGFWFKKPSANAAAIKAFVVNRVGDFGLILGMAAIYFSVGSLQFDTVFASAGALAQGQFDFLGMTVPMLTTICCFYSWARWASRRSFYCTLGCPMRWKARRRYPRLFMPPLWSRRACFSWRAVRPCLSYRKPPSMW
jgi:NADH-quinone oxidoreductase subunit L